jgi:UDP-N-acetylmuramyl pentapeptide phosphotransferase/UDP-N-acetylglucosamine-1-phosphate transferase
MAYVPAILSLLTGIAGWFYMFYSKAAQGLSGVEEQRLNNSRIRLRRIGGMVMLALAVLMYVGWYAVSLDPPSLTAAWVWLTVLVLLGTLSLLALVDMRLTFRLRHRRLTASRPLREHVELPADDEDPVDHAAR